jgi:hypothetical protein
MTYQDRHKSLVDALRKVGIWFDYGQRIDLAWLRHHIEKVTDNREDIDYIRDCIDLCVSGRIKGLEGPHKDGRYINAVL